MARGLPPKITYGGWTYTGTMQLTPEGYDILFGNTPTKETDMPTRTPQVGEIWPAAGRDPNEATVLLVCEQTETSQAEVIYRPSDARFVRSAHPDRFIEMYRPPKEAWEEPAQIADWFTVTEAGALGTQHYTEAAAMQYATHRDRAGIRAVVQCDVTPRLDTLKKVER